MSNLSYFLKENKIQRENFKLVATQSILDENGKPIEFEFKPLDTNEHERIKDDCLKKDKFGNITLDRALYSAKILASACVYPNLNDSTLQDSYGVRKAEDLITKLVDEPSEFNSLFERFCVKNATCYKNNLIEEAKN